MHGMHRTTATTDAGTSTTDGNLATTEPRTEDAKIIQATINTTTEATAIIVDAAPTETTTTGIWIRATTETMGRRVKMTISKIGRATGEMTMEKVAIIIINVNHAAVIIPALPGISADAEAHRQVFQKTKILGGYKY